MKQSIQGVIDTILEAVPGAPLDDTVDTYKSGDPSQEVTGIVTTFLASYAVIQRAVQLGANLIITHEPTYYNHRDDVDWLADDSVYGKKRQLLDENNLVVWRFHDYWHLHRPDGILTGLLNALDWKEKAVADEPPVFTIEPTSVRDLARQLKTRLGIRTVRVVGSLEMDCHRVGILPGAVDGKGQIEFLRRQNVEVLICGEINEWETCEYVRDAVAQGWNKALVVLGHANSEEPGMRWLAKWLGPKFPDLAITHVPVSDPFHFL
jgi:putative NIF3 family GTP cyclohydrolase 1 type 2